ncbi:MAG: methyltransferase, partial [Acetobacteraceae bacterium]|nr:methyltransferase [Acetobacteraceae bacterium]
AVPAGGDAYLLQKVLHDWDDVRAGTILTNCRRAMPAGGRLLVAEYVVPTGDAPSLGKVSDLTMLVMLGGRERTEAEFRALLERGGFAVRRIVPTASPFSVIEATPG